LVYVDFWDEAPKIEKLLYIISHYKNQVMHPLLSPSKKPQFFETNKALIFTFLLLILMGIPLLILIFFTLGLFYMKTIVFVVGIILSILSTFGFFTPVYKHYSTYVGHPIESPSWSSIVELTAKGSFIANKKIHIRAELLIHSPTMLERVRGWHLFYYFEEAWKYPLERIKATNMILSPSLGSEIKGNRTIIEDDAIFTKSKKVNYSILVVDPSNPSNRAIEVTTEHCITIAPQAIATQIWHANMLLGLSWIGILITALSLL